MKKIFYWSLFIALLCFWAFPWRYVFAQSTPGYTKISPSTGVTTTTFTTGTLVNSGVYNFEVTAQNAAGESGPSNIVSVTIPSTGTHTVALSWTASPNASFYNVYDQQVTIPNPPTGLVATPQ